MAKEALDASEMTDFREFKVLRALAKAHTPIVKSELQRRARMSYTTLKETLTSLENRDLVTVSKFGTKRTFSMVSLNEEHKGVKGLKTFLEESEWIG